MLEQARLLLVDVFMGDMSAEDSDHALGGIHVLAWDGDELVGHGAVVLRRLLHDDRARLASLAWALLGPEPQRRAADT